MKVTIKQRNTHAWSNIKSYDTAVTSISPKLNKIGRIETGLTPDDEERLEKALNLPKGTLAFNSPYWETFTIRIRQGELELDTAIPEHEIQYKVLLTMDKFAKNLSEKSSKADFVIYNEEQEAEVNNVARNSKKKAYTVLNAMSETEIKEALIAMGKKPQSTSPQVLEDMLGSIVDSKPDYFLSIVEDKFFKQKVFLNKLLQNGILKKVGSQVVYDKEVLGYDVESTIVFLIDPKNDTIVEALKKQLKEINKK